MNVCVVVCFDHGLGRKHHEEVGVGDVGDAGLVVEPQTDVGGVDGVVHFNHLRVAHTHLEGIS